MTDPDLERAITLAAEAAVRGRKQYTTAEDVQQELRMLLLVNTRIEHLDPAELFSKLKWAGVAYAAGQQRLCEIPGTPATTDRWGGLVGVSALDVREALLAAGYAGDPADVRTICASVRAHMNWHTLGKRWGVSDQAAYKRFRRAAERVRQTRQADSGR